MIKLFMCAFVAAVITVGGTAFAQKGQAPVTEDGIDLTGDGFSFKVKEKQGVPTINNFTFYVANIGDTDAPNSRIEYWLSDNAIFNELEDPMTPGGTADVLIHTQSLGKVKSGRTKKRTVGGGKVKQLGLTGLTDKYFIAVIDSDDVLLEANEDNNVIAEQIQN